MSKKTTIKTADMLWHEAINPIADYCATVRGAKAEIIKVMNRIPPGLTTLGSSIPWNRQQVESYLKPDATKRLQPRLGAGLALIRAAEWVMHGPTVKGKAGAK